MNSHERFESGGGIDAAAPNVRCSCFGIPGTEATDLASATPALCATQFTRRLLMYVVPGRARLIPRMLPARGGTWILR